MMNLIQMTSHIHNASSNGGKSADTKATSNIAKTGFSEKEKDISGETVPGWTIMQPLKRKGHKGSDSGIKLVDTIGRNGSQRDNKAEGDLKIMESSRTNGSGDGYSGVGEVETLHDVRSDDELLEAESTTTRHHDELADHTLQSNGAPAERTVTGGVEYKVYKRRWFGLIQLVLLNIIVSWDVSVPTISQPCGSPVCMTLC
jgi:hypothetical protein